jgi:ABC-type polysaccharide/polyol phosphate transport system ATPase subunit
VIVAEGISKRYPRDRVRMFPPVVMFHRREWFRLPWRRQKDPDTAPTASSEQDPRAPRSRVSARRREYELDREDLDDDDMDDDDDDDDEEGLAPARLGGPTPMEPGEMFWALRDVSFTLRPGAALGVLGGPGAGKTTLLNILGGRAFLTEGRVMTRGTIAPMPQDLAKAITLSGSGNFQFNLVMGCRLVGLHPHVVKRYREEIEEFAQPVLAPDGNPAPGAMTRLAVATAVTLPADVILFEDGLRGVDDNFKDRVVEVLQRRKREGTSLVVASRRPDLIQELCDEVIVLEGGSIADRPDAIGATNGYDPTGTGGSRRRRAGRPSAPVGATSAPLLERAVTVPPEPGPFHTSAALISAEIQTAGGERSKRLDAAEELSVAIRLETATPDTEVHCGVCFTPRSGEPGVRVEHPEPLRLRDPRSYEVVVRVPGGTLPSGTYRAHANALVATGADPEASAITRDLGRLQIVGDSPRAQAPAEEPVAHWDGCVSVRVDAEWSLE